jgi:hypothetical protein
VGGDGRPGALPRTPDQGAGAPSPLRGFTPGSPGAWPAALLDGCWWAGRDERRDPGSPASRRPRGAPRSVVSRSGIAAFVAAGAFPRPGTGNDFCAGKSLTRRVFSAVPFPFTP